ncbi:hypothetical protein [Teredinibacter sp. KSP-S5-2]|uniref:hypothetical protein n=1 Tax=Teredinibacter sp. KSP-S5-2 TaxID=3034506 RepID=UPI0029346517|nr:hypothetical protein [Teredinibacter sp. KSP-S5-2]WNO11216.1 hypothetical protein P5V12_08525 [Teredinibacter sp. KSP-S5-2]
MSDALHSANLRTPENEQDWSHVAETINMLYLAVCQIEATLHDSNTSVDTLTRSFTLMARHTNDVSQQIQTLTKVEELDSFKHDISSTATEIQTNINSSIQAFQFYDRVCQRLDHIARSLEKVSGIMEDHQAINSPSQWRAVQEDIKQSYTMEAERIMFEYIMRGGKVKDALEIYNHHFTKESAEQANDSDEIELF